MEPNGQLLTQEALRPWRLRVSTGNKKCRTSSPEIEPIPRSSTALPNHRPTEVESTFKTWQTKYIHLNVYSRSIQE